MTNIMTHAFKNASMYVLSDHAKMRIRQRVGITSADAAKAWVAEQVKSATSTVEEKHLTHYMTDLFEIICDGAKVVTIKPMEQQLNYIGKFNEMLTKESARLLAKYNRELRKADIAVADAQLKYLRAKNPNTREIIQRRMTEAGDMKAKIEDEIKAIKITAKRYGVEVSG